MEPKKGNQTQNTSIMGEGGIRHITIELSLLKSSLKQKIEAEDIFMSHNCCTFKTPKILFRNNENAFLPNAFSIGPFHHGKENLKATEKIKHKYMQGLVRRSMIPLSKFIEVIEKIEKEARQYYAGPIELCENDFIEMLVLDGCFIIELFRKKASKKPRDEDDPIFTTSCLLTCLRHALILLENQIPWKVLELLFDLTAPPNSTPPDQLAIEFFAIMFSYQILSIESLMCTDFAKHRSKHILDLLRNWMVLSSEEKGSNLYEGVDWQPFPSATKLEEAGVKFIKVTPHSILDLKFRNGTLSIPSFLIDEFTETIFRNLISFEQCTPNYPPIITSYALLMDNLIDTTKDMEILCDKKIIDNWFNPTDGAQCFNKLYIDAYVQKFYYNDLCNEVNKYCERNWPKWRANLMRSYFHSPWAIVGVTFGASAWILTLLQTVFTIHNP